MAMAPASRPWKKSWRNGPGVPFTAITMNGTPIDARSGRTPNSAAHHTERSRIHARRGAGGLGVTPPASPDRLQSVTP